MKVILLITLCALAIQEATSITNACWREQKNRNVLANANCCLPGFDLVGGVCFPRCTSGYYGIGPECYERCPAGWQDTGSFCVSGGSEFRKAYYSRGSGSPPSRPCKSGVLKQMLTQGNKDGPQGLGTGGDSLHAVPCHLGRLPNQDWFVTAYGASKDDCEKLATEVHEAGVVTEECSVALAIHVQSGQFSGPEECRQTVSAAVPRFMEMGVCGAS